MRSRCFEPSLQTATPINNTYWSIITCPHILEKPFEVIAILRPGNVICLFSVGSGEVVDGSMIFDPVQELLQEASGR